MKRLITMTICTIVCMATFGATVQRAILSHKGVLTMYDANHWQEAITDAVAGDTVYFTAGYFSGESMTISKPITLIGSGVVEEDAFYNDESLLAAYTGCAKNGENSTVLDIDIIISIPGSSTLTSTLMEGIKVTKGVSVTEPVNKLTIKRCQLQGFGTNTKVTNFVMENCCCYWMSCVNLENPDIHNCYFYYQVSCEGMENLEFSNCCFCDLVRTVNCTLTNCIVMYRDAYWSGTSHNTLVNCIYSVEGMDPSSTLTNCWTIANPHTLTKDQLIAENYIGTDGTVVGPLGGSAPFTLIPSQPYVESSTLNYNKSTKKLSVNVTVKKGK